MIHLVTQANRALYSREMRLFHHERREHFILERGWPLLERDGGEYDVFDDEDALYLMALSCDGGLDAGCRLRPTLNGGVIPDVFPHLVAATEAPVRAPGVYECTRYFSTRSARGRRGFEARSRLHIAMQECVRDRGGHRLLGFCDLPLLTHLRRFSGLRLRPVGLPATYDDGGAAVAFEIGVETSDLVETARRLEIPSRQLFEAPAWLPVDADVLALAQATAVLSGPPTQDRTQLHTLAREAARRIVHQPDIEALMERLSEVAA